MNIQQLRYIREVARNGLSVSQAAKTLHTSQPGISQQIRSFEEELGLAVFVREKNRLTGITPHGQAIVERLNSALQDIDYVGDYARSLRNEAGNELIILTSHTQARYVLPDILKAYSRTHPAVRVEVRHRSNAETVDALLAGDSIVGVVTGDAPRDKDIRTMLCGDYRRILVVPKGHALLREKKRLTLRKIAEYPLITYEQSVGAGQLIIDTFRKEGLSPRVILFAIDADVMKACVESGLGIAILPTIAFDPKRDANLRCMPTGNLFPPSLASVAVHRKRLLRPAERDFIRMLAPQMSV